MDKAISLYLELSEIKNADENANFTVIIPAEKEDAAKSVVERTVSEVYPYAQAPEIRLKSLITQRLTEEGIANRVLPQRVIANDDTIWTLSLVTDNFYFYMDREHMNDISGIAMFRTQLNEELVYDSYMACAKFWEEIIDVAEQKATIAYINSYTSDILGSFKEEFTDRVEAVRDSEETDGESDTLER